MDQQQHEQPYYLRPDARIVPTTEQPERYDRPREMDPQPVSGPATALWAGLREIVTTVLPALLLVFLIQLFLAQATRVESYSMEPTLYENQRLVIEKVSYHFSAPDRGDIVVLEAPDGGEIPLIKRVVGLPGETIEIREGQVYIDGQPLAEPYLRETTIGFYPATRTPDDHVFVMGDNRDQSRDSRSFGSIPLDSVIGRAWVRYWPVQVAGILP